MTPERLAQLEQLGTQRGQGLAMIAVHVELCAAVRNLMAEVEHVTADLANAESARDRLRSSVLGLTTWADGVPRDDVPVDEVVDALKATEPGIVHPDLWTGEGVMAMLADNLEPPAWYEVTQ